MKKKLAAFLCGILCVGLLATPVYAAGESYPQDDEPAITITDGDIGGGEVIVAGADTSSANTTTETVDGVPFITKVYELPQGAETSAYTASFEQDGYLFTKHDVSQRVQEGQTDTKTVTKTEMLETESDKISVIITEVPATVLYSEDGYTGQLSLDVSAIVVEGSGTTTYSYRVEDVREYTNLDRNDAAYVPKTALKNGVTLQLENIEWVVMGQYPVDGRMMPNLFKAIATYAGTATGSRNNGYTAILTYAGEVTHTVPGNTVYTIIFRGEPIAASVADMDTSEPAAGEEKSKSGFGMVLVLVVVILLSAGCLAVAGVRIVQRIRDKRDDNDDDNFTDYEDYAVEEPGPVQYEQTDTRPFEPQAKEPQMPFQSYPQDEFNIDELFNEEGFFNG